LTNPRFTFGPIHDPQGNVFAYKSGDGENWALVPVIVKDTTLRRVFTDNEATFWLEQEPSFPKPIVRRRLTDNSSHADLTEPLSVMHL